VAQSLQLALSARYFVALRLKLTVACKSAELIIKKQSEVTGHDENYQKITDTRQKKLHHPFMSKI
jgi:hypothetical protein